MKLRYVITKSDTDDHLVIQELGELDKDEMVLYCEVSYDKNTIQKAIKEGKSTLIAALRTKQLYPPSFCAGRIAEVVTALYTAKGRQKKELNFNDKDLFGIEEEKMDIEASTELDDSLDITDEDEAEQLDNLLEDDTKLKSGEKSLKIEDIETPRSLEEEP